MESEDEMQDAWAGTSDGEFDYKNEDEDEESDALVSDDENDESDYGFDYSNADDLHPSSRLPQVYIYDDSTTTPFRVLKHVNLSWIEYTPWTMSIV